MTAADQPTTEPSGAVKHLVPPHSRTALCGVPMPEGTWTESPRFTRNPENRTCPACIAPAPQPAADTVTEVQWGVRLPNGEDVLMVSEERARWRAETFLRPLIRRTVIRTPWEEA